MMSLPLVSSLASNADLDEAEALRTSSALIVPTTPFVPSIALMAFWSWSSSTVRSVTTMTESKVFELSLLCKFASPCASHAIEFVLPEPAECWIRYLLPAPSTLVVSSRLVTASHWWKRGKMICLVRALTGDGIDLLGDLQVHEMLKNLQPVVTLQHPLP